MTTFVLGDSPIKLLKEIQSARNHPPAEGSGASSKENHSAIQTVKSFFPGGKDKNKEHDPASPNPPPVPPGGEGHEVGGSGDLAVRQAAAAAEAFKMMRSEEHTSELQSHSFISYAV